MLVSLFVFGMVMTAATNVFSGSFSGYRKAKAMQSDVENAQYAISIIAKTLRTSSIIKCNGSNSCVGSESPDIYDSLVVYDYSRKNSDKCIEYSFENNRLYTRSSNVGTKDDCETVTFSGQKVEITTGYVSHGKFYAVPSSSTAKVSGRVTIFMEMCYSNRNRTACLAKPNDRIKIQSSASLRDYAESGVNVLDLYWDTH